MALLLGAAPKRYRGSVTLFGELVAVFLPSAAGAITGALAYREVSMLAVAFLTAIGTVIAAGAAASAARSTRASVEMTRFALGVTTLRGLLPEFDEEPLRRARRLAAAAVTRGEMVTDPPSEHAREAEEVLDFFETLGLLVRLGALDAEMVWHTFYHWVEGWWHAASPLITRERAARPQVWGDFVRLKETLAAFEQKRGPSEPFDLEAFLRDEIAFPA